jgi:hypothetical protein
MPLGSKAVTVVSDSSVLPVATMATCTATGKAAALVCGFKSFSGDT